MQLSRPDLTADLQHLRGQKPADAVQQALRALADNVVFEENVADPRRDHFEGMNCGTGLKEQTRGYFARSVQGRRLDHKPSTFDAMNADALMSGIEENQTIVRLECIEQYFTDHPPEPNGDDLETKLDAATQAPLVRWLKHYPGQRPAFACFKAEVKNDLKKDDWLIRLIRRLGLRHYEPAEGQTLRFALMEYSVGEVMDQARAKNMTCAFAKPTVLDSDAGPHFFPAPKGSPAGFAADLDPKATGNGIREILHIRLDYQPKHVVKIGRLTGPIAHPTLPLIRNAHLHRVRSHCERPDFGSEMP